LVDFMHRNQLVIRNFLPHEWELYRGLRLRSLADAPDAYGSTLAAEQERPGAVWAERLALACRSGRDDPLVAELDGVAAGLVWAKFDTAEPAVVNIFQMWVAPELRGHGIAKALLREAIAWARANGARAVQLGVETGNAAAVQLYARAGFAATGIPAPLRDGSHLLEQVMLLQLDD
jgi:ribosomal protein S18 acetylase RimI-like enzyme